MKTRSAWSAPARERGGKRRNTEEEGGEEQQQQPGSDRLVCTPAMRAIFDALDLGRQFPSTTPLPLHAYFHSLLYFLHSLPTPLFRPPTHPYVDGADLTAWCQQSFLELPQAQYSLLLYLLVCWREAIKAGGTSVEELSGMAAEAVMQRDADAQYSECGPITPREMMEHCLRSTEF